MSDSRTEYLAPGQSFGEFKVVRLIGRGGMGQVYLVEHPAAGRYAVKIVDPAKAAKDPEYVKRFAREGRFARKHRHPNLIPVHDIGQDPETGLYYLIMDYMPGGDIGSRLAREGRFAVEEAVRIVAQVARALEAAHASGMVHRDIKPENIMFDAGGTPKLADLGVAKFSETGQTMLTSADVMLGTPAYMAPEQITDSHGVDAQADVYSLGIVFFEMLAGRRPNAGLSVLEIVTRALRGESIPDVRIYRPDVPDPVAHLLNAMCEPRRERRLTTHRAVELLNRVLAQLQGTAAPPEETPSSVPPEPRDVRSPTPAAGPALNHLPRLGADTPEPAEPPPVPMAHGTPSPGWRFPFRTVAGYVAAALLLLLAGVLAGVAANRVRTTGRVTLISQQTYALETQMEELKGRDANQDAAVRALANACDEFQNRLNQARKDRDAAAEAVKGVQARVGDAEAVLKAFETKGKEGDYDRLENIPREGPVFEEARRVKAERDELRTKVAELRDRLEEKGGLRGMREEVAGLRSGLQGMLDRRSTVLKDKARAAARRNSAGWGR